MHYYILRTYVPSSFLVFMTWGTFWLPPTTYPARVGIIVTNFLASSFILQGASSMYTKVPYTTAIEVYLLVNITFILAVMLEYIAVIKIPNCVALKKVSSYFNIFLKSTRYEQSRYDLKRKANVMDKTTLMAEPYHKRISVKQEISLVIHIKTNQKTNKADKCDIGTN